MLRECKGVTDEGLKELAMLNRLQKLSLEHTPGDGCWPEGIVSTYGSDRVGPWCNQGDENGCCQVTERNAVLQDPGILISDCPISRFKRQLDSGIWDRCSGRGRGWGQPMRRDCCGRGIVLPCPRKAVGMAPEPAIVLPTQRTPAAHGWPCSTALRGHARARDRLPGTGSLRRS